MIRAIFWDNDGVLVNTEHLYFQATREVLASVGILLTREQYIELFLTEAKGAWHLAAEQGVGPAEVEHLRRRRNARYGELLAEETLMIDGVEETLAALHGKYVMGVVTSSRRDHFEIIHRSTGLLKYFDFVVAEGDYMRSKPDPEPYRVAVGRSGFPAEECIAIEDSLRGLSAARAAGLRCLVVPSGFTRGGDFAGASKVLVDVRDVVAELSGNGMY